jgi:suppressor of fused-like protein
MSRSFEVSEQNGWEAIESYLRRFYGAVEPTHHWGTLISFRAGGPDPLDGISAYSVSQPVPHTHYVSFGMSELYDKESHIAEQSGWGFEFTMRVKEDREIDPSWVCLLFQELARYVFRTGNPLCQNEHVDFQRALTNEFDTNMSAVLLVEDPVLGSIDTTNGRIQFLQLVAVTADELEAVRAWQLEQLVALMRKSNPYLISDMQRPSIMNEPQMRQAIRSGMQQDGSSCGYYYMNEMAYEVDENDPVRSTLTLSSREAEAFQGLLTGRLLHGRIAELAGAGKLFTLQPAAECRIDAMAENQVSIHLTTDAIKELVGLLAKKGQTASLRDLPNLSFVVKL